MAKVAGMFLADDWYLFDIKLTLVFVNYTIDASVIRDMLISH